MSPSLSPLCASLQSSVPFFHIFGAEAAFPPLSPSFSPFSPFLSFSCLMRSFTLLFFLTGSLSFLLLSLRRELSPGVLPEINYSSPWFSFFLPFRQIFALATNHPPPASFPLLAVHSPQSLLHPPSASQVTPPPLSAQHRKFPELSLGQPRFTPASLNDHFSLLDLS